MGRRIEIWSTGIDEFLQGIGGDPFGVSIQTDGLRVPTLPTPVIPGGEDQRYLFNLCSFTLPPNCVARIRGYRQLLTIGTAIAAGGPRFVEQQVISPNWRFPDGNVSWHLVGIVPNSMGDRSVGPVDRQNFASQMSDTPALLYLSATCNNPFYPLLSAYTPPNKGRPWGESVREGLGTFYSLHTGWGDGGAWTSLDIPLVGPQTLAFFASVRQTNPSTRILLPPFGVTPNPLGIPPEEQFLLNFPNAQYWRVGGALVMELEFYGDTPSNRICDSGDPNQEAIR